jgi:hypothetical protein
MGGPFRFWKISRNAWEGLGNDRNLLIPRYSQREGNRAVVSKGAEFNLPEKLRIDLGSS